jgi:hypothetical protein
MADADLPQEAELPPIADPVDGGPAVTPVVRE